MQDWNYIAAGCMELTLELRWGVLAAWRQAGMHNWPCVHVCGGGGAVQAAGQRSIGACMGPCSALERLWLSSCVLFSCCSPSKWPAEDTLAQLWEDNLDALLAFPLAAAYGGCARAACLAATPLLPLLLPAWPACPPARRLPAAAHCAPAPPHFSCCRAWGSVREEGKLRSSKGQELAPLGGANITGACAVQPGRMFAARRCQSESLAFANFS